MIRRLTLATAVLLLLSAPTLAQDAGFVRQSVDSVTTRLSRPPAPFIVARIEVEQTVPPQASKISALRFDYLVEHISLFAIVRFELCYDGATTGCDTVTPAASFFVPTAQQGGPPLAGLAAYKRQLPALTPATHTVAVKACALDGCGPATAPFTFTFLAVPGAPTGTRLIVF